MYQVKFENFEGPLDVLLELFEKKKLDITKLSLMKVADDYLEYIENRKNISLENLSDFLLTASQLILIKSKALLPLFEFTKEEEEEIEDLKERLLQYQNFKKKSDYLRELLQNKRKSFSRDNENLLVKKFHPVKLGKSDLAEILKKLESDFLSEKVELQEKIMEEIVTMEEKVLEIKRSLEKRMKIAFSQTIKNSKNKIEVIVSFLAMLEMIKQKIIFVRQEQIFSEIILEKRN